MVRARRPVKVSVSLLTSYQVCLMFRLTIQPGFRIQLFFLSAQLEMQYLSLIHILSDYPASTIRSGNACNLLLYCTYYYSFFVYIINVIEFTSGSHLQIYNIKNGLSSPACFFHTSDDKSNGRISIRSAFCRCIGSRQLIDIFLRENSISVSYTHLDVYKRQLRYLPAFDR